MISSLILYNIGLSFSLLGAFVILSSTIGIIRFPDFYSRLHPAGLNDALGLPLILIGTALQTSSYMITIKIILIIVFMWTTSTTSTQALAKAAYKSGLMPNNL